MDVNLSLLLPVFTAPCNLFLFFSPLFFNVTSVHLCGDRRMIVSLKDWETPFSQSQCVSPVIACGQSRGDTRAEWLPLKQSDLLRRCLVSHRVLIFRRFARLQRRLSSSTLYHYPGNTCRARVLCNFHYKRKRSEMDRLATRIYCGVAAFEREHALGCEKKEYGVPVGLYKQRKRRAQSDMLAASHICRILRWSTY